MDQANIVEKEASKAHLAENRWKDKQWDKPSQNYCESKDKTSVESNSNEAEDNKNDVKQKPVRFKFFCGLGQLLPMFNHYV